MKPLYRRFIILAMTWMILGSATPAKAPKPHAQAHYYWYYADNDSFLWYESTAEAINDLEDLSGHLINTNAPGGTLIGEGYTNNVYPHNSVAWVFLYAH